MFDFFARLRHAVVGRPVEMGAVVGVGIKVFVFLGCEKRLVRVEGLDLQKPIVFLRVALDEFQSCRESFGLRKLRFVLNMGAIHPVLAPGVAKVRRNCGVFDLADPGVAFLPTQKFEAAVARVVGAAAVFPVVLVVGCQVAVDARFFENFRHGIIERFERPPTAVQKVGPRSVQIAARGHTGHGANVGFVESDSALRQTRKVGRVRPLTAVGREQVPVEAVEHHENGFHKIWWAG